MRSSLTYVLLLSILIPAVGQQDFWTIAESRSSLQTALQEREYKVNAYEAFNLNLQGMKTALRSAPAESTSEAPLELKMPMPDGTLKTFTIVATSVMPSGLAARYPAIKTYRGWNPDNPRESVRLGYGPDKGFYATILSDEGRVYIEKTGPAYISYFTKENPNPELYQRFTCEVEGHTGEDPVPDFNAVSGRSLLSQATLRTYRLAMACTGQYAQYHGGTVGSALEAIVLKVNRLNQVFERDLAIRVELVENNDLIVFTDPETDGLSNGNVFEMLEEISPIINTVIGEANYDFGHVLSRGGGGVAALGAICQPGVKARGVTGAGSVPEGDPYVIDYLSHEIGHQLGANHTMNSCSNIEPPTAFEPGSGTTIMAYAGICGDNNVASNSDDHYHNASLQEIFNYTRSGLGNSCPLQTPTTNSPPDVEMMLEDGFWIPLSTPFELTATATDSDGDSLTYCWEQYDLGPNNVGLGNPQEDSPLFRSLSPTPSPTRVFPRLNTIISNDFDITEILPFYGRNLTFRCTVRDNNPQAGSVAWETVAFKADETAGPFQVEMPNSDTIVWSVGDYQEVRWDVANTTNARVNCQHVDILLSIDGGLTYPYTLLEATPNIGSAFVEVPDAITSNARIRVQATENIFFDINDFNFTIEPALVPGYAIGIFPTIFPFVCLPGEALNIEISTNAILGYDTILTLSLIGELPAGSSASFTADTIAVGESTFLSIDIEPEEGKDTINLFVQSVVPGLDTSLRELRIITVFSDYSALEMLTPVNGQSGILFSTDFSWVDVPSAERYDIQIATSPTFEEETIFDEAAGLTDTLYQPEEFFEQNELYFWRIRPESECGVGEYLAPIAFRTSTIDCVNNLAADLPVNLSNNPGVRTSMIFVTESGTISDINIDDLEISYLTVNVLRVSIISPAGTRVVLFDQSCFGSPLLRASFDDEAPNPIACPPITTIPVQPHEPLSAFDGEDTFGEWTLEVEMTQQGTGGGALEKWGLEFCATIIPTVPTILTNEVLTVPPGGGNTITVNELEVQDNETAPGEMEYTIVTLPENGQLFRGGDLLGVGDEFTQQTINLFNLAYVHDGSDTEADGFTFIVENPEGGWIPTQTFSIQIDEDATVGTFDQQLDETLKVFPNPVSEQLNITFGQVVEGTVTLRLITLQGQTMVQQALNSISGTVDLDVSTLPKGIYLLSIQTQKGIVSRRIVVQ